MYGLKILASTALLTFAAPALAYVQPSFYVVRMIAKKHMSIDEGRFRSKVTFYDKNGEQLQSFNETLILMPGEHVTIRLSDAAGNEVMTRSRRLSGDKSASVDRPIPYDLTIIRDSANLFEHLKAMGLPLKTETALYSEKEVNLPYKPESYMYFERLDRSTAIVVGDRPRRDSTPTLWVEKDSFLPLQAIFPTSPEMGISSEPVEYRFSSYQPHKNFLYPRVIHVVRNGSVFAKIETQDVKPGPAGTLEEPRSRAGLSSNVKEAVENYFKWVR